MKTLRKAYHGQQPLIQRVTPPCLMRVQWLPSLFILHKLNDFNNIRFAASSTYTLPQYKEKAFFQFEEVTQVYLGNPALYASTNYNFDLKWEQFPSVGELVSVTAFSRIIKNPINDVSISSASNDLSYVNSGDQATVFGVEFGIGQRPLQQPHRLG